MDKELTTNDFIAIDDLGDMCYGCYFELSCGTYIPDLAKKLNREAKANGHGGCLDEPIVWTLKNQE